MFLSLPPSLSQQNPGIRHQTRRVLPSRHVYIPREVVPGSAGIFLHVVSGENQSFMCVCGRYRTLTLVKPNSVQKFSGLKIFNTLSLPLSLYGSEIWALKKRIKRLTSAEIVFFRRTARYTLFDYNRNEEILEALKVDPVDEKLRT
jgi:hypothetical protein